MHPHHVRLPSLRTLDIAIFLNSPSSRHPRPEITYNSARPAQATTPPSSPEYASDEFTKDHKPRKLSRRACLPCQKHHTSCGNVRPCMRCVSRGHEEDCIDVPTKRGLKARKSAWDRAHRPSLSRPSPPTTFAAPPPKQLPRRVAAPTSFVEYERGSLSPTDSLPSPPLSVSTSFEPHRRHSTTSTSSSSAPSPNPRAPPPTPASPPHYTSRATVVSSKRSRTIYEPAEQGWDVPRSSQAANARSYEEWEAARRVEQARVR
ncbi:hypothetical protein BCR35DRAFT_335217 [Leucosporidium creatinivorum]|uniref:Transcription activator of gluconeogenesis ERT1 n=1 Tax=Leucosporidium creatinivorum TaxID=106004 RepID=A0A1Y2DFK7_9BASI|nr:hypothetical protein BCR35DRAFT_335217 [Leucosporidium creatinivorum]